MVLLSMKKSKMFFALNWCLHELETMLWKGIVLLPVANIKSSERDLSVETLEQIQSTIKYSFKEVKIHISSVLLQYG